MSKQTDPIIPGVGQVVVLVSEENQTLIDMAASRGDVLWPWPNLDGHFPIIQDKAIDMPDFIQPTPDKK